MRELLLTWLKYFEKVIVSTKFMNHFFHLERLLYLVLKQG